MPCLLRWQLGLSYGYDQIDRLVSEKRTGSHPYWYDYGYDGSGNRLTMVQRDGSGNIVGQKSYTYDSGNKLLQEVANGLTTVYQYDPNGNTISKTTGTSQVRYYWDDEDKMVRLEDSVVMNFKTDGLSFRRMKEVVGQGQTWFVYDMGESDTPGLALLIAEYDQKRAINHSKSRFCLIRHLSTAKAWAYWVPISMPRILVLA